MATLIIVLGIIVALVLVVGILTPTKQNLTDYELYGKDADEFLKDKVGEDYYNEHYK